MTREYRVWNESGDLLGEYDTVAEAEAAEAREREACAKLCETDGQEDHPGRGDFRCGVMSPHGIHIQVSEDGEDITSHYDAMY